MLLYRKQVFLRLQQRKLIVCGQLGVGKEKLTKGRERGRKEKGTEGITGE